MKPVDYVKTLTKKQRVYELKRISAHLGVSYSYLRHMCNGIRPTPAKFAVAWEEATNGLVAREDIFPELKNEARYKSSKNRNTDHFAFNDSVHQM
jgi:DNA-binding transcriptional regulator YdaS (Cro superfamily)